MKVTEETKRTAQAVLDYIIMNPEKHSQKQWVATNGDYFWGHFNKATEENICDTTMCIAGTAVFLEGGIEALNSVAKFEAGESWVEKGADILGLAPEEADAIFYTMNNGVAIDLLSAIAQGDEDKFWNIYNYNY